MKFKYKKFIYVGSFSVMLLGMMIFSTMPSFSSKKDEKAKTEVSSSNKEVSSPDMVASPVKEESNNTAISTGELKKDAYPEVNQLIQNYLDALIEVDEKKIADCVDKIEFVGIDTLPKRVKEIEKVDDLICYTLDGPEENSYIVYAYNEVKFKNINTKSTALDGYYVKKDETGKLKVILSPVSEEIQKIINEDSKREDVSALISDVNTKLKNHIKSDKQLAELLNKMRESEKK